MYWCYLTLKDELIVGIDDDRFEIREKGYQPQIPLLTGGGVEGFHRQAAVDEGNDDAAVRDFLQPVNQTDVAIVVSFSAPVLYIKYYILFII